MKSLKEFAHYTKVFQDATELPEFFDSNLVDPSRVVKAFINDPNAHIRIYYYQYLKLCFEQDNVNFQWYTTKMEEIINSSFKFFFYEESDPQIFNDMQAKSFIIQFFGEISESGAGVEACLNQFPIMDQIFILFFRSLLIVFEKAVSLDEYLPRDVILDTLNPFFNVDVQRHGDCITYTDSDIFVYELSPSAIYMAYMDDSKLAQQPEPTYIEEPVYVEVTSQQIAAPQVSQETLVARPTSEKSGPAKDSYIAGQFMDYTAVTNNPLTLLNSKAITTLKSSGTLQTFINKPEPKPTVQVSTEKLQVRPPVEPKKTTAEVSYQNQIASSTSNNYINNNSSLNSVQQASNKLDTISNISNNWQSPITVAPSNSFLPSSIKPNENQFIQPQQPQFVPPVTAQPTEYGQYGQYKQSATNQFSHQINQVNSYQSSQTNISQSKNQYTSVQNNQISSSITQINPPFTPQNNQIVQPQINQYAPPQLNQYGNSQNGQFDYLKQQQPPITPKNNAPEIKKEAPFYSPKQDPSFYSPLGYSSPKIEPIIGELKPSSSLTGIGKKKPFGLNVSEEFTNSLTMKSMAEPHRSNVQNMKTRARAFRSSLVNYIK